MCPIVQVNSCVRALIVLTPRHKEKESPLGFLFIHFERLCDVTHGYSSEKREEKEEDLNMGWYNELTTACDWTTPTAIFGNDW